MESGSTQFVPPRSAIESVSHGKRRGKRCPVDVQKDAFIGWWACWREVAQEKAQTGLRTWDPEMLLSRI
jgi:hypothetical protein